RQYLPPVRYSDGLWSAPGTGIGKLDGNDSVESLLNHFWPEAIFLAAFDYLPLEGIIMHNFGQCSLKASFMHTAITRAHGVGKAVHGSLVASRWLQCRLHLYAVLLLGNANDVLELRRTGTCGEIAHIIGQAFTRIENTPNLLIGGIIPGIQVKSH